MAKPTASVAIAGDEHRALLGIRDQGPGHLAAGPRSRRLSLVEVAVGAHQRQQLLDLLRPGVADLDPVGERLGFSLAAIGPVWKPIAPESAARKLKARGRIEGVGMPRIDSSPQAIARAVLVVAAVVLILYIL